MVSVINYGYFNTSSSPSSGVTGEGVMRAYTENAPSVHLWAYKFRGRVGKPDITAPTFRYAAYTANSNREPNTRVAQSEEKTATTLMTVGSQGAIVDANVTTADGAPTNNAAQLWNGVQYSLAILSDGNAISHGQIDAADIAGSANETRFFDRTTVAGSTTTPTTFGSFNGHNEGHMTVWLECHDNEAPRVPVNRSPSGTIQTTTPTFTADFRDRNGAWGPGNSGFNDGDKMKAYQIQVRRVSDAASFWSPAVFSASSGEQTANAMSRAYAGTALVRGTAYEWRVRHQDMFLAWGDWSDWLAFTPANLGYVTLNSTPTGKQNAITGISFNGRWFHNSGTSTNAVEIRLKQDGVIVQTSPTITKTVASSASPGTLFTLTWSDTSFTDLDWGGSYSYQMRGRDTGGQWSDWSADRTFTTNAVPTVPTNLTPNNSQTVTGLPVLSFRASDTDDTVGTGLQGIVRVYDSSDRWLTTKAATYNTTTGYWEYQLLGPGTSEVKTLSYSGTISGGSYIITYNGVPITILYNDNTTALKTKLEAHPDIGTGNITVTGSTSSGGSAVITFVSALAGINVNNFTITNNLTGAGATVSGTSTTQGTGDVPGVGTYSFTAYSYDGDVYSGGTTVELSATTSAEATFVYSSGPTVTITSPTEAQVVTTVSPTVTWSVSGGTQQQYRMQVFEPGGLVSVYDTGMLVSVATSAAIPSSYLTNGSSYEIIVSVIDTTPLTGYSSTRHFTLTYTEPAALTGVSATPIKIGTDPVPSAIQVTWDQSTAGTFVRYILRRTDLEKPLALIPSQATTSFIDYTPRSGVEYTYRVRQVVNTTGVNIAGPSVFVSASVDLEGAVLASVDNPDTYRAVLSFGEDREHTLTTNEKKYLPWNAVKPTTVRGLVKYWMTNGNYFLIPDIRVGVTAQQRLDEIEALAEFGGTMCYRDERGRKRFMVIDRNGLKVKDVFPSRADITLSMTEEAYEEGLDEEEI